MATIYDVAKKAGVSASTVSLAFNQPHRIKAETKDRVYEAAKALNYQANNFARSLAGGRSKLIGFLPADIRFASSSVIAKGVEEVLSAEGFATFIANTDGKLDKTKNLIDNFIAHGVSGLIISPTQYGVTKELIDLLQGVAAKDIPVITIGHKSKAENISHVTFDPHLAMQEATDYLIEIGHQRIGFVGGVLKENIGLPRYMGYHQSLLQNGVYIDNSYVYEGKLTPKVGREGLMALLKLDKPPTAIIAANDIVASGMIDTCLEENIKLPDDISLLSFDGGGLYERATPAVTRVIMPSLEIGRQAALALIERWNDSSSQSKNIVVNCGFEIRDTTAPPKALQTV